MHGALAAAMSAATARIDHVKGADRRKRIMGAASGAMMAEAVSEYMMNGALANVEEKLNASGHAPNSQAYADLRTQLMNEQLRQIKMFAQLAVAASAEAMRFDLNAAMFAANNALENNFAKIFLSLGKAFVKKAANETGKKAAKEAIKIEAKEATKEAAKETAKGAAKNSSKGIAKNLKPAKLDKTRAANANKRPHGNSLNYKGDTHVYSIHRFSDKRAVKVGESTRGVRTSDGASKRAESQARKLNRETGEMYYTRIRKNFATKAEAKKYEADLIKRSRDINGSKSLPLNKNGH
ncbi:MAG: hypothetical protein KF820_05670 [Candidatus Paracaedibacteraceae bacterium]|nr:hypothetical protein [Candidatus Paracaedibacteraceae bacterium]